MDLSLSPDLQAFRDEVRSWLADHLVGEFTANAGVGGPADDIGWDIRLAWDRELAAGGWLCLGWPDERPPAPGLERAGWSQRQPLEQVVLTDRWSETAPPVSHLRAPAQREVVGTRDEADRLLTPPGSLGVLDRAVDRAVALGHADLEAGVLVLAAGHHRVLELGVSAFSDDVTDEVVAAARAGEAVGVVAATAAGLEAVVVDCGTSTGNVRDEDALSDAAVEEPVS